MAPNAIANGYNIYDPDTHSQIGAFVLNNFANPTAFLCGAIGAVADVTSPETAKLCAQYLGPALNSVGLNYLPVPFNSYLMKSPSPENLIYSDPALAPGGSGPTPGPPDMPPAVSAYTGLDGDQPPPPGYGPPSAEPGSAAPDHLPAEPSPALFPGAPVPGPTNLPNMLLPAEAPPPSRGHRPHDHRKEIAHRMPPLGICAVLTLTGCTFNGLNSLPLPGTVGHESGAATYRVQFANIGTLESNSPVLIDDVVVGSVGRMTFSNWHVDVEVRFDPASWCPRTPSPPSGRPVCWAPCTSLSGRPLGSAPSGRLAPGATISTDKTSTFPSTESTLSSLSAVVNGGGLGQIGDIVHNFSAALTGREGDVRDLLTRLDTFVGTLNRQRDNIVASIAALNRLAGTLADQRDVITRALNKIPAALDVLIRERPRITTALDKLRVFSDTATGLVNDTQDDLVTNLQNLEPTLRALADVGPGLDSGLAFASVFPFGQNLIDRGLKGDYFNFFGQIDLTVPRLKRSLLLGTRFGDEKAPLVAAPGEPYYLKDAYDPQGYPVAPPPAGRAALGHPRQSADPSAQRASTGCSPSGDTTTIGGRRPDPTSARTASTGVRGPLPRPVQLTTWRWMMLTRFVRIQLTIFAIVSVIGMAAMIVIYMQVPTLLGLGHITVTLQLPASGGLYEFSNVTYRGVEVGKVTEVKTVDAKRVDATMTLNSSPKIPANLTARVRSVSAVGEQYVDLLPANESPPYLHDGSVITSDHATIPQRVGPMLDQLNALVGSIPKDQLSSLLDESFKAFNGAGYDFGSLLDSSSTVARDLNGVADQTRTLIDDSGPLLDGQAQTADSLKLWARSLAGITDQVVQHDPQVRSLLQTGPDFADEVSRLLTEAKPTLPVLLANLTSVGQVLVTYNKSVQQLLVLLPPYIGAIQSATPVNNPTGRALGDFAITIGDPPACTVGFLPPSSWRSPDDMTEVDTPDGLYCKLPQDSPIAVRGARNYPCIEHPGKRAATVQDCDSDRPFEPLATRQHVFGPAPFDPNLVSQGIPPDGRVDSGDNLYAPVEGTPPPPVAQPPTDSPPPVASPNGDPPIPAATSSSFADNGSEPRPAVAMARYNARSGAYMASDGHMYHQSNLAPGPDAQGLDRPDVGLALKRRSNAAWG